MHQRHQLGLLLTLVESMENMLPVWRRVEEACYSRGPGLNRALLRSQHNVSEFERLIRIQLLSGGNIKIGRCDRAQTRSLQFIRRTINCLDGFRRLQSLDRETPIVLRDTKTPSCKFRIAALEHTSGQRLRRAHSQIP